MCGCPSMVAEHVYDNTYVSETTAQYERAYSDFTKLKEKPLYSSQYEKTTQLELITPCNEKCKQVNEEINKHPLVFAKTEDTKKALSCLLSNPLGCGNNMNITAYQAEVNEGARKANTYYKQCQLEEQLQTSTTGAKMEVIKRKTSIIAPRDINTISGKKEASASPIVLWPSPSASGRSCGPRQRTQKKYGKPAVGFFLGYTEASSFLHSSSQLKENSTSATSHLTPNKL